MTTPPPLMSQFQGIMYVRVGAQAELPSDSSGIPSNAPMNAASSTQGNSIASGGFYISQSPPHNSATGGLATVVQSNSLTTAILAHDPPASFDSVQVYWCSTGDNIIAASDSFDTDFIVTSISTGLSSGGTRTIDNYAFAFAGAGSTYDVQLPPSVCGVSNGSSVYTGAIMAISHDLGDGNAAVFDPIARTVSTRHVWNGYDTYILDNGLGPNIQMRSNAAHNVVLSISGVYLGLTNRPLIITTNTDVSTEKRQLLHLSNSAYDTLLAQPVAQHSIFQFYPCDAGWYAPISIDQAKPPQFFLFDHSFQNFAVGVFIGTDAVSIATLFDGAFGKSGTERMFIPAELDPSTFNGKPPVIDGGQITMTGIGATPLARSIAFTVTSQPTIAIPHPPVIQIPCAPCAPMQIANDGSSWAGNFNNAIG